MVLPRFAKLPASQQQAILSAALEEFAALGFHGASLNRIIERAGISKGSMYYYFDSKEDLYEHVARTELEGLLSRVAPRDVREATSPSEFWSMLAGDYLRVMQALEEAPQLASLIRGWVTAPQAGRELGQDLERGMTPWLHGTIAVGQQLGAVRTDLPAGLLVAVISGMGQAMDIWLLTRPPDATPLSELTAALIGMMRRAMEPGPGSGFLGR